ncbi:MAG: hypothetical protein NVS3B1_06420 [Marmoricola sp.]
MKLNLGCGAHPKPVQDGWVNLDTQNRPGVDVVATVPPIPFPDNHFEFVELSHVIEHIPDTIALMNEINRVLMPGGILHVLTPHALHEQAYGDPTHVRFFVPSSFHYYAPSADTLGYGIVPWGMIVSFLRDDGWQVEAFMSTLTSHCPNPAAHLPEPCTPALASTSS